MKRLLCLLTGFLFIVAAALPVMAVTKSASAPAAANHKVATHSTVAKAETKHHTAKTSHQVRKKESKKG
jgi:hypothetical protein